MREMTFTDIERAGAAAGADDADLAFVMNEDEFRLFYERTARTVWAYLSRITGDARLADDLLQETYYRFLRARVTHESDDHRRHYLFRIATNLAHDHRRRPRADSVPISDVAEPAAPQPAGGEASRVARRVDLTRALSRLRARDRDLLWLAYAQGSSHLEIAAALGLKVSSIKPMLFRARKRLAALIGRDTR